MWDTIELPVFWPDAARIHCIFKMTQRWHTRSLRFAPTDKREERQAGLMARENRRRTDTERRVRQCERLARLLRLLHLIMGNGRWDADSLADELDCSRRTIYRMLQTLDAAGVPWYSDPATRSYRVRPGYKFTELEQAFAATQKKQGDTELLKLATLQLLENGERFLESLRDFHRHLTEEQDTC